MVSTTPVPFRYSLENRSPRDLWSSIRQRCDGTLADGQAFVLVLKNGHSVADRELLSAQEHRRALRYQREEDRLNFMLGRTAIDRLLRPFGASLPCSIGSGRNGKPFIEGAPDFNLSHSGPYVACGVCHAGVIGVDVETFERFGDPRELFAAVTHPAERSVLEAAPVASVRGVFRRCWTRKEAILKAAGSGLTHDLSSVDTRLAETSPVIETPLPMKIVDVFADGDEASLAIALSVWVTGVTVCFIDVDKSNPQATRFP
jgi:phosphopantetheinyl transferase